MIDFFKGLFSKKSKAPNSKEIISRLSRKSGRTTRIIDECVQDFFEHGECEVKDHYLTRESNLRAFTILLDRLEREHGLQRKDMRVDRKTCTLINLNI